MTCHYVKITLKYSEGTCSNETANLYLIYKNFPLGVNATCVWFHPLSKREEKRIVSKYAEQTAPCETFVPQTLLLRVHECIHRVTCASYSVGYANKGTLL